MKTNKLKIQSYTIVKINKGFFMIEYKIMCWSDSKVIDKKFKSITKAQEYALLHFDIN